LHVDGEAELLGRLKATVLPTLTNPGFAVLRAALYTFDELVSIDDATAPATLDECMGSWFASSAPATLHDALVRALHDATIEVALARFVVGRRVVGVMGGHAVTRDAPAYRTIARLGRDLARARFVVATGGGPGAMEAANLGAWFEPFDDSALDGALDVLSGAPSYTNDQHAYVQRAIDVRNRWPHGGESLGIPTWVYLNEPTAAFARSIAKYFTNSLREDGLLAIARSGVVYTPGAAGTQQEIFADSAQNSLNLEGVRSPMVFFGTEFFTAELPELVGAVRRQAAAFGWEQLILVTDDPGAVVDFIDTYDPDREGTAGVDRRRGHPDYAT
jgi:predicted Rossmann-fold nucleotide-binding protein